VVLARRPTMRVYERERGSVCAVGGECQELTRMLLLLLCKVKRACLGGWNARVGELRMVAFLVPAGCSARLASFDG
jgi:hypothetical protein